MAEEHIERSKRWLIIAEGMGGSLIWIRKLSFLKNDEALTGRRKNMRASISAKM